MIDALDECGSEDDIRLVLQLLVEVKNLTTIDLGVFVTSRPEIAIRLGFEKMPEIIYQNLDLRDTPRQITEHDIAQFLRQEFSRISQERRLPGWPSQAHIQELLQRAGGLFIYAATVRRFVDDQDWNPQERLFELLRGNSADVGGTAQLDETYSQVLRCALTENRRAREILKLCDRFRQSVGSIVTLSDTLSVSALAELLKTSVMDLKLALGNLHSVLDISSNLETPIRLLHPSFHDFVFDEVRCEDKRFLVDKASMHGKLLRGCLEVIPEVLKPNVCRLPTLGSSPHGFQRKKLLDLLPPHAQHACQYCGSSTSLVLAWSSGPPWSPRRRHNTRFLPEILLVLGRSYESLR